MLSVHPQSGGVSVADRRCPECAASWDDEVSRASEWLGAGAHLEGFCACGSYLVWEHLHSGGWTLATWVAPDASDQR